MSGSTIVARPPQEATMKARPTTYNGIQMRSRLEARVASFLDNCGFEWAYEPQAFASPAGQYLPDFRTEVVFPWHGGWRCPVYIEVKPTVGSGPDFLDVLNRMEVIRRSENACLVAAFADEWTKRATFYVRMPSDSEVRLGAIVQCPECSWRTIGVVIATRRYLRALSTGVQADAYFFAYCPLCELENVHVLFGEFVPLPEWDAT